MTTRRIFGTEKNLPYRFGKNMHGGCAYRCEKAFIFVTAKICFSLKCKQQKICGYYNFPAVFHRIFPVFPRPPPDEKILNFKIWMICVFYEQRS